MILNELFEARQVHPEISYKEKKLKGVLDRVIAVLSGNKSGAFTRIAQRYKRIDRLSKLIKEERDTLNKEVKAKIRPLFDVQDDIYTRVIETASLTITLSKAQSGTNEYLDIEGYVEELEKLMPGMEKQIEALRKQFTIIEEFEKDESLRVRVKEDENLVDKISAYAKRVAAIFTKQGEQLDIKLDSIKSEVLDDIQTQPKAPHVSSDPFDHLETDTNIDRETLRHLAMRDQF